MPELPEVRALAERCDAALAGRAVTAVRVLGFSSLKTVAPSPDALVGERLAGVSSRGKFLCWRFSNDMCLLCHLGNAGRLDLEAPPNPGAPRGAVLRLTLAGRAALLREHGRERRAGIWMLASGDDGPLADLGPEPDEEAFAELLRSGDDHRHLHTLLRDQHSVAGIGRGYADDALQRAGLSPFASLHGLDEAGRARLLESVRAVLGAALARERTRTGGLSDASLGDRFAVHRRSGQPCPTCGTPLQRVSYESHEVTYCPTCQTRSKILADRRLSRLLR
jgi:formamidopyrimidine-DNA glycosylase